MLTMQPVSCAPWAAVSEAPWTPVREALPLRHHPHLPTELMHLNIGEPLTYSVGCL